MPKNAFYDQYDYQEYWHGRDYENAAELIALRNFLPKTKGSRRKIVDVGAAFGRLATFYAPHFQEAVLLDPSADQLAEAKDRLGKKYPNTSYVVGDACHLPLADAEASAILCVRVSHHIKDFNQAITEFARVITPGGYLLLEVANKLHAKAYLRALLHGQLKKLHSEEPVKVSNQSEGIEFVNHHPDRVVRELEAAGFKIIARRSVSNFRSPTLKKVLPRRVLLFMERISQSLLGSSHFGPSLFYLAQRQ